ncbi:MAG: AMP-binding protein, partial [Gluconacetobacter diazotrophicus]|nr:AMP-binding protein [Gluconacetobacter diazotrophicus]
MSDRFLSPGPLATTLDLLFRPLFRLVLRGGEHLSGSAPRICICNNASWIDVPVLLAALPMRPVVVLDPAIPFPAPLRSFLRLVPTVPVDPDRADGLGAALDLLRAGRTLLVFPEGRPTNTGTLMLVRPAAALLADAAGLPLTPLHLDGPQRTRFAPLDRSRVGKRAFPRFTVTVSAPVPLALPPDLPPSDRREAGRRRIRTVMAESAFRAADTGSTLLAAIRRAGVEFGLGREAVSDPIRGRMSFRALLAGARAFAERFAAFGSPGTPVALMLPNAGGTLACLLGLQSAGLVPVMLNPRGGASVFDAARRATGFAVLLTVRPLVLRLNLADDLATLEAAGVRTVFLDDAPLSRTEKLGGLLRAARPLRPRLPDDPAVILMTSGSSGTPKAVVLSHRAVLANVAQVATLLEFGPRDRLLNALPLFHAMGLSSGTLLPLTAGARVFLHPNPLDYDGVPDWA